MDWNEEGEHSHRLAAMLLIILQKLPSSWMVQVKSQK